MGNIGNKKGQENTSLELVLERTCFQAGSALKGKVIVKVGKDGTRLA